MLGGGCCGGVELIIYLSLLWIAKLVNCLGFVVFILRRLNGCIKAVPERHCMALCYYYYDVSFSHKKRMFL